MVLGFNKIFAVNQNGAKSLHNRYEGKLYDMGETEEGSVD